MHQFSECDSVYLPVPDQTAELLGLGAACRSVCGGRHSAKKKRRDPRGREIERHRERARERERETDREREREREFWLKPLPHQALLHTL